MSSTSTCEPLAAAVDLAHVLPEGVIAFETRSLDAAFTLLHDEAVQVADSVAKRVREFSAGRACARAALKRLGIEAFPVRVGANRQPVWPQDIVGSITHTHGYAGAAVASVQVVRAIGVDAEVEGAVDKALWGDIATAQELVWLHALPDRAAATAASVLFSAKEAFYKCQFSLTAEWLNFSDVHLTLGEGTFEAHPCRPLRLESHAAPTWSGRFRVAGGLVLSAICIR